MRDEELRTRYQFLEKIAEGGVVTYRARDPDGSTVLVHHLEGERDQEGKSLLDLLPRLAPEDARQIHLLEEVDGIPVLVTEVLDDFSTLETWLTQATDRKPPPAETEILRPHPDGPDTGFARSATFLHQPRSDSHRTPDDASSRDGPPTAPGKASSPGSPEVPTADPGSTSPSAPDDASAATSEDASGPGPVPLEGEEGGGTELLRTQWMGGGSQESKEEGGEETSLSGEGHSTKPGSAKPGAYTIVLGGKGRRDGPADRSTGGPSDPSARGGGSGGGRTEGPGKGAGTEDGVSGKDRDERTRAEPKAGEAYGEERSATPFTRATGPTTLPPRRRSLARTILMILAAIVVAVLAAVGAGSLLFGAG